MFTIVTDIGKLLNLMKNSFTSPLNEFVRELNKGTGNGVQSMMDNIINDTSLCLTY